MNNCINCYRDCSKIRNGRFCPEFMSQAKFLRELEQEYLPDPKVMDEAFEDEWREREKRGWD